MQEIDLSEIPKFLIRVAGDTKESKIISMIERPQGASLPEIMKETGWQPHTVRGFISAVVKKKHGLTVVSEKNDAGERVYRIPVAA